MDAQELKNRAQARKDLESKRVREIKSVLSQSAKAFVHQFIETDIEQVVTFMSNVGWEYSILNLMSGFYGDTKIVKRELIKLIKGIDALLTASESLGEGATEILSRVATPYKSARQIKSKIIMELTGEGIDPLGQDPMGERWFQGLYALREETRAAIALLGEMTAKGGRTKLGNRLNGSPEEWLARVCTEFAGTHGCRTQAVVLKMVQAILRSEQGKSAMTRIDGRPAASKGRKAVRKVSQTDIKIETV